MPEILKPSYNNLMEKLKIFYDGKCHLCYREVYHYAKIDKNNRLALIDISDQKFAAKDYNLSDQEVQLHLHVQDEQGQYFKGVDAFIEIWKRLPQYRFLIPIFNNGLLKPGWKFAYNLFAKHIRPKLPKRNCIDGACSINHPNA